MSDKTKRQIEILDKAGKKISSSKKASLAFLQKIGIVTANGKLSPKYK